MKGGTTIILNSNQNDFLFVLEFNNKKVKDLNPLLRKVIDDLFKDICEKDVIKSWRNHINNQKGDIFIKINNNVRTLLIKKDASYSIHVESIDSFVNYLRLLKISESTINKYLNYHYAEKMTSNKYYELHKDDIISINKELNSIEIRHFINRFLLKGKLSAYLVDGLLCGTPNDFFYINNKEICEIILDSRNIISNDIHVGCLFIQPHNECLNNNQKYDNKKDYVQIKWNSLIDDILSYEAKKKEL